MNRKLLPLVVCGLLVHTSLWACAAEPQTDQARAVAEANRRMDGYYGIWFELGQKSEFGDKYSGGLGTYTTSHTPIAVYAPAVNKTFFVYGGTLPGERHLLAMVSCYDHATGTVPRPVIVHDKQKVNDPHDNPSLAIDGQGHIWVFVAGRATIRDGFKYRSTRPYDISKFELVEVHKGMAYPQPWYIQDRGFLFLFCRYTKGRELYWQTSRDGSQWGEEHKLVGFGGHYQTTDCRNGVVFTAFNWHPGGDVDRRTNLYFLKTDDMGKTWKTASGETVATPLSKPDTPALVRNYAAEQKLVYIQDVTFDAKGRPVILYVVSNDHRPGPQEPPRSWWIAHWTGAQWDFSAVTSSPHNYCVGALYVEKDGTWRIIGPSQPGPQKYGTGGEIAMWTATDEGRTWTKVRDLTKNSPRNHGYARRPANARDDFYAMWADGNADHFSESFLYFCTKQGVVYQLPQSMSGPTARPVAYSGSK